MQKRLVRKLDLEKWISEIRSHPQPKAYLEQYTTPPEVAAEILYIATYVYNDILHKTIVDLGCGTGRLAIGAALLGAKESFGVDIDKRMVKMAQRNSKKMGVHDRTHWIVGDIEVINGSFDTVLQNPPFGVQKRRADRKFIKKSLEIGQRVYLLHTIGGNDPTLIRSLKDHRSRRIVATIPSFFNRIIERYQGKIMAVYAMLMAIPPMFKFHKKRKYESVVHLYIIECNPDRSYILDQDS
jgi:putative methylase